MIGALRADTGICAQMTVNGGVKSKDFLRFVNEHLVPTLRAGDLVCWDNINMHKNKKVIEAIEEVGATVVFLPRYSPDMNPIEAAWSKVKSLIRKQMPATRRALKCAIRSALRRVTASDALGWFEYCGFNLPCP